GPRQPALPLSQAGGRRSLGAGDPRPARGAGDPSHRPASRAVRHRLRRHAGRALPQHGTGRALGAGALPEPRAIRAIAPHPEQSDTVYVGTQDGPYRSTDQGGRWEKLDVPDHGLPVWSLQFDPHDAKVMYAGYENCEIFRSEDGGEHWEQLPVTVRFPEVTVA